MPEWEYRRIEWTIYDGVCGNEFDLNLAGQEGWECINIAFCESSYIRGQMTAHAYLKRQKGHGHD